MSVTLYRKYRPQKWADIAGQNHIKVTLAFEVESGRTAHAYLFSGPRGVGKTTIARIMARALNCLDRKEGGEPCGQCESCVSQDENRTLDVIEVDAASHRGIDNVRDNIIENSRFAPASLKYKVFIIDEVHMLTPEAFNALLKTLEEPPSHAVFILATTELHKVPVTIVSRCQRFDFRRIPFVELVERLHSLSEREKVKVDTKAIEAIARQSDGCLRDAEGLLGKVMTLGDGKRVSYDEALVVLPRSDWQSAGDFVEALFRRDGRTALLTLDDCLEAGVELDQFANDVIELLRQTLMMKMGVDPETAAVEADEGQLKRFATWRELATVDEVILAAELMLEKRRDLKSAHPPQLPLELAVARICQGNRPAVAAAVIQDKPSSVSKPDVQKQIKKAEPKPEESIVSESHPASLPASLLKEGGDSDSKSIAENGKIARISLKRIREIWQDFIFKSGEKSHSLTFLLGCAEPIGIEDGCLSVGFTYAFHCDKFNQEKSKRIMEEALQSVLGTAVRLNGVVTEREERDTNAYVTEDSPFGVSDPSASANAQSVGTEQSADSGNGSVGMDQTGNQRGAESLAAAFGGEVVG